MHLYSSLLLSSTVELSGVLLSPPMVAVVLSASLLPPTVAVVLFEPLLPPTVAVSGVFCFVLFGYSNYFFLHLILSK